MLQCERVSDVEPLVALYNGSDHVSLSVRRRANLQLQYVGELLRQMLMPCQHRLALLLKLVNDLLLLRAKLVAQLCHFGIEELDECVDIMHVGPVRCLVLLFRLRLFQSAVAVVCQHEVLHLADVFMSPVRTVPPQSASHT